MCGPVPAWGLEPAALIGAALDMSPGRTSVCKPRSACVYMSKYEIPPEMLLTIVYFKHS